MCSILGLCNLMCIFNVSVTRKHKRLIHSFSYLVERNEGDLTTIAKIVHIMRMFVLQAPILRIPDGTIQPEGENFIQNGKLTKETTMNHDTMTILVSTGITEVTLMNKIFGSTVTGKGNESGNAKGLSLTGTETTRGGRLSAVRAQCTCGAHRVLEHPPHSRSGCQVILKGGFTADPQTGVGAVAHFLLQDTINLTNLAWNAIVKMRRQIKKGLLILREWKERDA